MNEDIKKIEEYLKRINIKGDRFKTFDTNKLSFELVKINSYLDMILKEKTVLENKLIELDRLEYNLKIEKSLIERKIKNEINL